MVVEERLTPQQRMGRLVRRLRKEQGMTQEQFADAVGRARSWVWKLEDGRIYLAKAGSLRAVAAVLGIDPARLLIEMDLADSAVLAAEAAAALPERDRLEPILKWLPELPDHAIKPVANMAEHFVKQERERDRDDGAQSRLRRHRGSIAS